MTSPARFLAPVTALFLAVVSAVPAQMTTYDETYSSGTINLAVPDNSPIGNSHTLTIGTSITDITSVTVTLSITGSFNGDMYAYLQHTDSMGVSFLAVLLNRSGRTSSNPDGYFDSGFSTVTFDTLAIVDVHNYQSLLNPMGGALTGTFQPDGRATDPASTVDTDPRTALLDVFNHADANGTWTMFVADFAAGGTPATVTDWSLRLVGVPEPSTWTAGALVALSLAWARRRRPAAK